MDCPTCERSFSSAQGMRQHHTKVHGEPLNNRQCKGCNTRFYDSNAQLKYCDDCDPNSGSHNGNYSGAKETATCQICGVMFEFYPSEKDGVYCPACVREADGLLPENPHHERYGLQFPVRTVIQFSTASARNSRT